jgi:hypothetical protein
MGSSLIPLDRRVTYSGSGGGMDGAKPARAEGKAPSRSLATRVQNPIGRSSRIACRWGS